MGISIINFDAPLRSFKFTNQQTLRITERLKQKQMNETVPYGCFQK